MSEIRAFFRFCPGCGRRFHVKLVSKKLVNIQRESFEQKKTIPVVVSPRSGVLSTPIPVFLQEGEPATVDVEEFQFAYQCKHCGHEWSEKRIEEHKES